MSDETSFSICLDSRHSFRCQPGESVLAAMVRQGIGGVAVGCRAGGCGACRIRVSGGGYRLGPVGRNHLSEEDQNQGFALACRLFPETDLCISPAPKPKAAPTSQQA